MSYYPNLINSQVSHIRLSFFICIIMFIICCLIAIVCIYEIYVEFNGIFKLVLTFLIISILVIINYNNAIQLSYIYKNTEQTCFNTEELKQYDEIIIKPKSFLDVILYGKNGFYEEYIDNTENVIIIDTYKIINELENQYIKLSDGTKIVISEDINKDYIDSLENKECSIHYIKNKKNGNMKIISVEKNIVVKENYNASR